MRVGPSLPQSIRRLVIGLALFIASTSAPSTSAQQTRSRVIVVRSYSWEGERGHLARTPLVRALVRDGDDAWTECAHVVGATTEGTFDAVVTRSRVAGVSHARDPIDCALTDVTPAPADVLPLLGGVAAQFGPFSLGAERAEVAALIGVDATTLPEATDARTIVRHGQYRLVFRHGWLLVVAAFLDELPAVAAAGATTIAPSTQYDDVVSTLGLAAYPGRIGRADLFEPDLPHADAVRLARSRLRTSGWTGAIELDGRVLLYVSYPQHDSDRLARLRSLALNHALSTRAAVDAASSTSGRAPRPTRELITATRACGQRGELFTEAFGRCACEAACRVGIAFDDLPDEVVSIRMPFVDIDGLELQFGADHRVEACGYTAVGHPVDVHVVCPR